MTEDFYDLLDVPPDASQEAIRRAFREQVRVYHPDLNDDDRAQAQFTALKTAYDVLGDPVERRAYDRLGHMDYCAKRAKNIPSPDQWKTPAERGADSSTTTSGSKRSTSTSTGSTSAGAAGSSDRTTRTASATAGGTRARSDGAGGTVSGGSAGGTMSDSRRAHHSRTRSGSTSSPFGDNALVRWWRARNFAWPLLWIATITYVVGLAHFGLQHATALASLREDLLAAGSDPASTWAVLSGTAHDVPSAYAHVTSVELVTPPLDVGLWYAALAGVVVVTLVALLGARIAWRDRTLSPVSIDETIVFGLALGLTSTLLGGPLLAGSLLLPLLFGVVVHRTRQLPGWSPSYAYVVAVSAPIAALAIGAFGVESLPVELGTVLVLPLCGALGLPLRVQIRKRFGI